jgi:hybrid cluster-associated redox disulfide protein
MKGTKKTDLISDIIKRCPEAEEVFSEYELHCAICFLGQFETLEEGAKLHGMSGKEINKMVNEINEKMNKKEK